MPTISRVITVSTSVFHLFLDYDEVLEIFYIYTGYFVDFEWPI